MKSPLNALIIEDVECDAKLLIMALEEGGYEITSRQVDTPQGFKSALTEQCWDIVFSDHSLPRFNSLSALEILGESGLDIPFIIISGAIGEDAVVAALKAGAGDYLVKGNWTRLIPAVKRELADAESRRAKLRAEDALRESEERFRNMADAAPVLIAVTDPQCNLTYVNKAALDFLKQPLEALNDGKWLLLTHPDDRAALAEKVQDAFQRKVGYSHEQRIQNAEGNYHWMYTIGNPRFTLSGEFAGMVSCTVDISEQKAAEQALAYNLKKEKLVSRVVEFNSQSSSVLDILNFAARELGLFLDVDRCLIVKYTLNEFHSGTPERQVGYYSKPGLETILDSEIPYMDFSGSYIEQKRNCNLCLNLQDSQQAQEPLRSFFKRYGVQSILLYDISYRGSVYGRVALQQCDQQRVWTAEEQEIIEVLITHLGEALYQAELYQKAQAARNNLEDSYKLLALYTKKVEQSNLELEHFATIASHDLQAPLRKVMAFADMLRTAAGPSLNSDCQDYLNRMCRATQRMQAMITDLLDLSRITRKGKPFQRTDLNEVLASVMEDLAEAIHKSDAQICVGDLCSLDADRDQLQQVFVNLISNALKFQQKDVVPRVRISSEIEEERICVLHVRDNGIGIKPEHFEKIFEVFTRLHGQESYPGTGIGLSLVKKIIERHQGEISVSSEFGAGSEFIIRLPLRQG